MNYGLEDITYLQIANKRSQSYHILKHNAEGSIKNKFQIAFQNINIARVRVKTNSHIT